MENNKIQMSTNVGDAIISRIDNLCKGGLKMPKDYNFVNAIKMSMLKLQDTTDKNGNKALEICEKNSIQSTLFKMVTRGLNAALDQCYFVVRGKKLCLETSYFGKVLMVKRVYPDWTPMPVVIYDGDEFEYEIDATNGRKYITKHKQKLENTDKDFIGGYMYLPNGDLYTMTKKQIDTAWLKSSNKTLNIHKEFTDKMVKKTIINTGLNMFINSTMENYEDDNTLEEKETKEDNYTEYEVVNEEVPTQKSLDTHEEENEPKTEPKTEEKEEDKKEVVNNDDDDF